MLPERSARRQKCAGWKTRATRRRREAKKKQAMQKGGMPVAALTAKQAGGGSRILILKPYGGQKQKRRHPNPEIVARDYLLISEIARNPDFQKDFPLPASKIARRRFEAAKKIRGEWYLVVWDVQLDGRSALVSFHRRTESSIKIKFARGR
jgi:hypothetical protein